MRNSERYVPRLASDCPPDAVVIPFVDEEDATKAAAEMNAGNPYHLTHEWAKGPASRYIHPKESSWVVLDTAAIRKELEGSRE